MDLYQVCSNGGLGGPNGLASECLVLTHRNTWKVFKNLFFQNPLLQMLEIRYVALPSGPLHPIPSLFIHGPRVQNDCVPGGTIEIHRKI